MVFYRNLLKLNQTNGIEFIKLSLIYNDSVRLKVICACKLKKGHLFFKKTTLIANRSEVNLKMRILINYVEI